MIKLNIDNPITIGMTFSSTEQSMISVYKKYEKTKNKNLFEEVIDQVILDKYSDNKELTEYIKSVGRDEKRMAILSLLDGDHGMWVKLNTLIKGNKVSKIDHLREVIGLFRKFVKIADVERKLHGEIMSPIDELVKPMVNLVPEEFWTDPNHKILDSSAGIGTFPIMCIYKLMNGLKDWEKDVDKRFKHIVENMIYFGELQARNVFLYLCALDPNDEYALNIYWGSFLDEGFDKHMKNVWNVEKFDLIIQNPPYQLQREGFKKTQPIWHLFVNKSLTLLREDKYMVMVHPSGWRNVDGVFKEIQNSLKERQIEYLKLHSFRQGQEMFGAAINFDYYCLKNTKNNNTITKILCVNDTIEELDISKVEFISDENIQEIQKLVAREGEERVTILYSRTLYGNDKINMSKVKTDRHIYPCIYTIKSPDKGNQPGLWFSSERKGHFGVPKVIFASGASGVYIDKLGEYAIMNFGCGIVDDVSNLDNIQKALLSEKFIRNIMGFKHSLGDKYNKKIISTFKKDFWKEFI